MKQITEDCVSFETAQLLKEKGFRAVTNRYYNAQYDQIRTVSDSFMMDWNDEEYMKSITMPGAIAIPTHQMALKWLREVHELHIKVGYDIQLKWYYDIISLKEAASFDYEEMKCYHNDFDFDSYEEAVEAAILYVLKNLI